MFRSSRKIDIDSNITAKNGLIICPVLKIGNLEINAQNPVSEEIKAFMEEHGFTINRIRYKGDTLLRLRCNGSLTLEQVEKFLTEKHTLSQSSEIKVADESASLAPGLEKEICDLVNQTLSGNNRIRVVYQENQSDVTGIEYNVKLPTTASGKGTDIVCGESIANSGIFAAGESFSADSPSHEHSGMLAEDTNFGVFAQVRAKGQVSISGSTASFKNTIVDAGKTMIFSRMQSLSLEIDSDRVFACNPHPDQTQSKNTKGRILPQ